MSELQDKINYKRNISKYLDELNGFSKEKVDSSNLLSTEETLTLQKKVSQANLGPSKKFNIEFSERNTDRFHSFVQKLYKAYSEPVLIWTELSNSCGAYTLSSVLMFNFFFNFDVSESEIVVLLAKDLSGRMVLDFSIDDNTGKEILEVELFGDKWRDLSY